MFNSIFFKQKKNISVVWTDVLQATVMIGSVVIVAVLGINSSGGLGEVWNRAVEGKRIFPPM